jgi:hypothetical protein
MALNQRPDRGKLTLSCSLTVSGRKIADRLRGSNGIGRDDDQ